MSQKVYAPGEMMRIACGPHALPYERILSTDKDFWIAREKKFLNLLVQQMHSDEQVDEMMGLPCDKTFF